MGRQEVITCDICGEVVTVGQPWINAGAYGHEFHKECADRLSFAQTMKALGLDEVELFTGSTNNGRYWA